MKVIFTVILFSFSLCSFSQGAEDPIDSCRKKKPLPCQGIIIESLKIDTVQFSEFGTIIDHLYNKMNNSEDLTFEEDRVLVLVMNTLNWSGLDKQQSIQNRYSVLPSISSLFDKKYKNSLYCKYNVCTGGGFSPYFIELQVQYMGNPFACDRYFVRQ